MKDYFCTQYRSSLKISMIRFKQKVKKKERTSRKKGGKSKKIYITLHRYNFVLGATRGVIMKTAYMLHAIFIQCLMSNCDRTSPGSRTSYSGVRVWQIIVQKSDSLV